MSVLIKGMEMPVNCFMCYLSKLNGERLFCNVTGEEVLRYKTAPECPMAEAQEVKRGQWTELVRYGWYSQRAICECSLCGGNAWVYDDEKRRFKYCPNCGARMVADDV